MPKKKIATEERYEALTKAVAGGELQMVKFLWGIMEEMDSAYTGKEADLDRVRERMNSLLARFEKNPPKDGKTPTKKELVAMIQPLIPKPIKGDAGKTPTKREILRLIRPLIPDPIPGEDGKPPSMKELAKLVKKAVARYEFPMPRHEWKGSMIRFEVAPDEWGEWVNLRGPAGEAFGPADGGGLGHSPVTVRKGSSRFHGVAEIIFADNLTVTKTANGVSVSGESGGSGGSGIDFETPSGTIDDSNVSFTVTETPIYLVVNGAQYFSGAGYSYSGGTLTLDNPVGTGGFIRSVY